MEQTIIALGYYLHKDGTPIVELVNDFTNRAKELHLLGYKRLRYIISEQEISKHLKTYNKGFESKRVNIKQYYNH